MSNRRPVAVIGAGVTGLTSAYRLAQSGCQVTVFEAAREVGGLASGFRGGDWDWPLERFYHHLFASDAHILRLVDEIGLRPKLFFRRPVTAQWWNGRAYPLDSPAAVLRYPGVPFTGRLRFGAAVAYLRLLCRDWRKLEKSTAADWCRRAMGERAYQALMRPLLEGKFGQHYEDVNTAWLWSRFKARTPQLGYFEGGFQTFADTLAAAARQAGARVLTGQSIGQIRREPGGSWSIATADGAESFDAVITTTSPGALARMAPDLPGEYLESVRSLKSLGAVVLTIALDRPLTEGVYWLNLPKPRFPFLALVEHTNFMEPDRYGGSHLVYCGDYVDARHEYFELTPEQILERFGPALKEVNPEFSDSHVKGYWLHREAYAQPVVSLNHSRNIPPIATPLAGLYWASMSQVYPWDRGTNFAVELGEKAAAELTNARQGGLSPVAT